MSDKTEHPWWFPQLADAEWVARIRKDYPEQTTGMSDDWVRDAYSDGWKYVDTWDHLGDARAGYEHLADAYLELLATRDAEIAELRRDAERLNWLDARNTPSQMGWRVSIAPHGNVSVQALIQLGGPLTSIRAAIDAAIAEGRE